MHFELVYGRSRQQIAVHANALDHFVAELLGHDVLHRFGNKFQVALIGNLKFYFIPDIGKKRPGIIPNDFVEHFFVRETNDPTARVVAGDILASEFPQGRVEITNIDHVAGCVSDLDTVADPKRPAHQNVDPGDKTLHRRLDSKADND